MHKLIFVSTEKIKNIAQFVRSFNLTNFLKNINYKKAFKLFVWSFIICGVLAGIVAAYAFKLFESRQNEPILNKNFKKDKNNLNINKDLNILKKIKVGLNLDYLKSIIGEPAMIQPISRYTAIKKSEFLMTDFIDEDPITLKNFYNYIYIKDSYFLILIVNKKEIKSFTIILRKNKFFPIVPLEIYQGNTSGKTIPYIRNLKLGKMTLNDAAPDSEYLDFPTDSCYQLNSKTMFYAEKFYYGYPGFYNNYIFYVSSFGVQNLLNDKYMEEVPNGVLTDDNEVRLQKNILKIRKKLIPNALSIISEIGEKNQDLLQYLLTQQLLDIQYYLREYQ